MSASTLANIEPVLPGPLLLVEDDPSMQIRMRAILHSLGYTDDAVQVAGSLAQARAVLADEPFALILIDVGLPDGSGIDLIGELHARDPALPILVISAWSTEQIIVGALQRGATGYLLKEREDTEIALSIRSALRGGAPIDPFVARHILGLVALAPGVSGTPVPPSGTGSGLAAARMSDVPSALSPREVEILGLVAKGMTNREIAALLSISSLTVACHIKNIYKKLAVNSRTQAVFEARVSGLLP
ncbi:response regulator transcription factor [Pandoraea sputorum]|uniref:Transcriptional regulatory protein devR (DosR) n=1 Tax=Pandoraea sputorum TaxID=93222 RepID=A0A239SLA7_9BURK|nr:response regulator transcription factor [Pandoraea sputorum]AJC17280.1 DNA-binding response regulator [Pandoraea sputorum]SNU85554.1 Transcriptional regulatory protein devR (dosR) [Pandoraea sputorum]VVE36875.1 DNA-binding response regulator [Pandoraea sputorum]VVE74310.1 DNA-binding response regulator [Pandoraea sputorum]BET09670.1 response regulator transcription factor [Pandoraea sputorum]